MAIRVPAIIVTVLVLGIVIAKAVVIVIVPVVVGIRTLAINSPRTAVETINMK